MPVAAVSPTPGPAVGPQGPQSPPAAGFDAVLAARLRPPSELPSISLRHMVSVLAASPAALAGGPAGLAAGQASAGVGSSTGPLATSAADPWGAAVPGPARPASGSGAAVLAAGERYLGVPYRWGGTSAAQGFDCSGFVQQVYADLGVQLPRVSVDQARAGSPVASLEQARPGDLVFWRGDGSRPNHIGIYAGEGRMLVAPRTGDVVRYQELRRPPDGIRRILA